MARAGARLAGPRERIADRCAGAGAVLGLAALALALAAGLGNRFGWWDFRVALVALAVMAWVGLAGLLASLLGLALVFGSRSSAGSGSRARVRVGAVALAVLGAVAGGLVFGVPFSYRLRAHDYPPIHDITTDAADPPRFVAVLPLRRGAPNGAGYGGTAVAAAQRKAYPDIAPAQLALAPPAAFNRAVQAARSLGWDIVALVPAEGRIEATDSTPLFGFHDDIVVRVSQDGAGSRIDVRSVSRVGRGDFGTNARRVRRFLERLSAGGA